MSAVMDREQFPSLERFYSADERRRGSGEVDFGVMWCNGSAYPHFRVSWIRTTGEVYALNQATGRVDVLGVVNDSASVSGRNAVIEHVLDGWSDHIHELSGLSWVLDRLREWSAL